MRSSSSELLLDQQAELRKKKLLELAKPKRPAKVQRTWRQRVWFYATAVLALTAMSAGSSLLFLVPLYVDPAISTLTHHFVDVPVQCVTTRREDLTGIFNCTWSSCREGCTSDMYRCTHIYVSYTTTPYEQIDTTVPSTAATTVATVSTPPVTMGTSPRTPLPPRLSSTRATTARPPRTTVPPQTTLPPPPVAIVPPPVTTPPPPLTTPPTVGMTEHATAARLRRWVRPLTTTTPPPPTTSPSPPPPPPESNFTEEAVLLVNIKGCGYPPDVQCGNFSEAYGYEGATFPCFYSRFNRSVVLTHYARDDQVAVIVHYFAIPFVLTVVTAVILCVMHCDCRCDEESTRRRHHHHHHRHHQMHADNRYVS